MLYRKPLMFMKSNGGASGASRQKGGSSKIIESYTGTKIQDGDYENYGYERIHLLSAGTEFSVKDAVRKKTTMYRLVAITSRIKEIVVLQKKNGKIYYDHLYQPLISDETRTGTIRRLLGFNAEKITIFSGADRKQLDREERKNIRDSVNPEIRRHILRK